MFVKNFLLIFIPSALIVGMLVFHLYENAAVVDGVLKAESSKELYKVLRIYIGLLIILITLSYLVTNSLIKRRRAAESLKDRNKELNGLYSLGKLMSESENLEEMFNSFLKDIVPQSMQFPDKAFGKIIYDGREYCQCGISECMAIDTFASKLSAPLTIAGLNRGEVMVGYTEPVAFIEHYEQNLVSSYAGQLSRFIEQAESREEMKKKYDNQLTLDSIMQISLKEFSLEEQLNLSLSLVYSKPWMSKNPKGAIFVVEDDAETLVLKVQRGMSDEVAKMCSKVKFGDCLCGQAALTGSTKFTDCLNDENYDDELRSSHGHYCVPIISDNQVIGLLNVYLDEGHRYSESEVEFLEAVANVLSSIIKRKQVEKEREKLWKQFVQAQKMESIGRLTGGVAHDFNNIITGILGYGELSLRDLDEDHPVRERINIIMDGAQKAANLIRQLLAFSRKQVLEMRVNNVNIVVGNMTKMLTRVIGEDISLEMKMRDSVSNSKLDETQIEQVLMNLVVNARDAMPHGGLITVRTDDVVLGEDITKKYNDVKPGAYVMISVEDAGIGMSKEVQEKIFEPFFTTKEMGKGTGLGLSTVIGIVKQHHGMMTVYSEPGQGTQFRVYLPAAEQGVVQLKKIEEDAQEIGGGNETILVIDDNETILRMLKEILENMEYTVIYARNAEEAIQINHEEKGAIDLMLTDVIMTGMNGWEAYKEIEKSRPDIKVIFSSGYMDNSIVRDNIMEIGMHFINKPYRPPALLKMMREVLDEEDDFAASA